MSSHGSTFSRIASQQSENLSQGSVCIFVSDKNLRCEAHCRCFSKTSKNFLEIKERDCLSSV